MIDAFTATALVIQDFSSSRYKPTWWSGTAVARWSRPTKLTYIRPG